MPSPFPGMDPYLEGYLWADVHQGLAAEIRRALTPFLRPHYVARLAVTILRGEALAGEISIMYPDVEVLRARERRQLKESGVTVDSAWATPTTLDWSTIQPAPLVVPITDELEFRQVTVEVRDVAENELITAIEIVSPVNKREPGWRQYREKRQRLMEAGVHLLEIDLVRRGARPVSHPYLPETAYLVALTRGHSVQLELWPLGVRDPLPVVPVPLHPADRDVPLDLGKVLASVYEEAAYDLSIDYEQEPPPPPLPENERAWLRLQIETLRSEEPTR